LHDEENTRWLVFNVVSINWAYKKNIDINKVWGQAWWLYNNGFDYELDAEDKAIREFLNEDYRFRRPEEELIARYFKPAEAGQGRFMSSTEIAMELNAKSHSLKINPNNIGKTIAAVYNLESVQVKINGKNTRGYWLHKGYTEADGEKPELTTGTISLPENPF